MIQLQNFVAKAKYGTMEDLKNNFPIVDKNQTDWAGRNALTLVVSEGALNGVQYLINEQKFDVNQTDKSGKTPLSIAILNNEKQVAMFLIQNGADKKHPSVQQSFEINVYGIKTFDDLTQPVSQDESNLPKMRR